MLKDKQTNRQRDKHSVSVVCLKPTCINVNPPFLPCPTTPFLFRTFYPHGLLPIGLQALYTLTPAFQNFLWQINFHKESQKLFDNIKLSNQTMRNDNIYLTISEASKATNQCCTAESPITLQFSLEYPQRSFSTNALICFCHNLSVHQLSTCQAEKQSQESASLLSQILQLERLSFAALPVATQTVTSTESRIS